MERRQSERGVQGKQGGAGGDTMPWATESKKRRDGWQRKHKWHTWWSPDTNQCYWHSERTEGVPACPQHTEYGTLHPEYLHLCTVSSSVSSHHPSCSHLIHSFKSSHVNIGSNTAHIMLLNFIHQCHNTELCDGIFFHLYTIRYLKTKPNKKRN